MVDQDVACAEAGISAYVFPSTIWEKEPKGKEALPCHSERSLRSEESFP